MEFKLPEFDFKNAVCHNPNSNLEEREKVANVEIYTEFQHQLIDYKNLKSVRFYGSGELASRICMPDSVEQVFITGTNPEIDSHSIGRNVKMLHTGRYFNGPITLSRDFDPKMDLICGEGFNNTIFIDERSKIGTLFLGVGYKRDISDIGIGFDAYVEALYLPIDYPEHKLYKINSRILSVYLWFETETGIRATKIPGSELMRYRTNTYSKACQLYFKEKIIEYWPQLFFGGMSAIGLGWFAYNVYTGKPAMPALKSSSR